VRLEAPSVISATISAGNQVLGASFFFTYFFAMWIKYTIFAAKLSSRTTCKLYIFRSPKQWICAEWRLGVRSGQFLFCPFWPFCCLFCFLTGNCLEPDV
jgi:hypothetical protein